ncbi:hypothetical protein HDF13_002168 [Edaphobacter lichenicola]|uniref:Uncharacterized protein n=1 Tax=Tunturiibacter gelidiferens TaxID=3069689 RepID=A0ACC5NZ52_9BACT|nr:hypothetical protein [Edaphobacter lichenicola]
MTFDDQFISARCVPLGSSAIRVGSNVTIVYTEPNLKFAGDPGDFLRGSTDAANTTSV